MINQQNFYPYNSQPTYAQNTRSNFEWIMVPTVNQVENVGVQPGQKAWIMVQNEPIFALRTADQMGLVQTDYYKFEKWVPTAESARSEYVTKDQMEQAIQNAIRELKGVQHEPIIQ